MPKFHSPFTLYKRRMKDGRAVWYFRFYHNGRRMSGQSTGETSIALARAYVMNLYKDGRLSPASRLTFTEYAKGWWGTRCAYVQSQEERGRTLSASHLATMRGYLLHHLLPFFGDTRLTEISSGSIMRLFAVLKEKGLAPATRVQIYAGLRVMMTYAFRQRLINENPCAYVQPPVVRSKPRGILTQAEVKRLFDPTTICSVWKNDELSFTASLTAAATGMRLGEILALRREDIHIGNDGAFVDCLHSWCQVSQMLKDTKTHEQARIPLPNKVAKHLSTLARLHDGFIFSRDGTKPVRHFIVEGALRRALRRIGISEKDRLARGVCFHSFRHLFVSLLRGEGIPDPVVQSLSRHRTAAMLTNYSHFAFMDYGAVIKTLEAL
jgi:integrase